MAIYTVLAPATRVGDAASDPMRTVFVRDSFSWPAFLIAIPWMLYRRMWLVLLGYIVVATAVALLLRSVNENVTAIVMILLSFLFALEANNLRRWTLERRGFRLTGIAEGRNMEEAEVRYFGGQEAFAPRRSVGALQPAPPAPPPPPASPAAPPPPRIWPSNASAEAGDVVGLFPAPASPKGSS
jgi:hypothetical protein